MEYAFSRQESTRSFNPKCPNYPLQKSPYIKIKLEALNLDKAVFTNELTDNRNQLTINPYVIVKLNDQIKTSQAINHYSPKWLHEYELEVTNYKTDKIFFTINTKNISGPIDKSFKDKSDIFLGFQMLPVSYLERNNLIGQANSLWFRLIIKKPEEYFLQDKDHILSLESHDPEYYKKSDNQASKESNFILI
jgi:hypothetical protein